MYRVVKKAQSLNVMTLRTFDESKLQALRDAYLRFGLQTTFGILEKYMKLEEPNKE